MTSTIPALDIRRRLQPEFWGVPKPFGYGGWVFKALLWDSHIILSCGPAPDGSLQDWWHASISRPEVDPSYAELVALHRAVWPDGYAYQVFAAPSEHVNIHGHALHLWGRPDGKRVLPDFGALGSI